VTPSRDSLHGCLALPAVAALVAYHKGDNGLVTITDMQLAAVAFVAAFAFELIRLGALNLGHLCRIDHRRGEGIKRLPKLREHRRRPQDAASWSLVLRSTSLHFHGWIARKPDRVSSDRTMGAP